MQRSLLTWHDNISSRRRCSDGSLVRKRKREVGFALGGAENCFVSSEATTQPHDKALRRNNNFKRGCQNIDIFTLDEACCVRTLVADSCRIHRSSRSSSS